MTIEMSRFKRAKGAAMLALTFLVSGILMLLFPSVGSELFIGPMLIVLGLVCSWFWYKANFGTSEDQKWVEDNF